MLAPCWEQTDQVVTHTLIRPLVALLYEFAKEASYSMAPVFPALEKIREIPILESIWSLVSTAKLVPANLP